MNKTKCEYCDEKAVNQCEGCKEYDDVTNLCKWHTVYHNRWDNTPRCQGCDNAL